MNTGAPGADVSVAIIRDNTERAIVTDIWGENMGWAPWASVTMSPTISEYSFGQRGTKLVLSAG